MNYLMAAVVFLLTVLVFWDLIKKIMSSATKILVNGAAGVLILVFLNTYAGWDIPVNPATIIVCSVFGLPAIATLIILYLAGML